jgi:hypothetical protein
VSILRKSVQDSLRKLARHNDASSLSNRLRNRRFQRFAALVDGVARPVRILDIGGEAEFWRQRGWDRRDDVEIVLFNLGTETVDRPNFHSVAGDATRLPFEDQSFDIAFSNSTIEHLFTFEQQRAMAREVRRVARHYWIQTPNFWFPVEPHFLAPAWQWLPVRARVWLLQRHRFGWRGQEPDHDAAERSVREVRLLRAAEMRELFPEGRLERERIGPLTKSFTSVGSR